MSLLLLFQGNLAGGPVLPPTVLPQHTLAARARQRSFAASARQRAFIAAPRTRTYTAGD